MMPETNREVSHTVERLKEVVKEWNKRPQLIDFPLTLAFGIAHWKPEDETDIEEVLKTADENMYKNKENY